MTTRILDLRESSISFNSLYDENHVSRINLILDIEAMATNDNNLIIVEGSQGIGKTGILLELAKRNNFNSFSYFYNPSSKFSARPDFFMQDIGQQMYFHVNSERINNIQINETNFNKILLDILRNPPKKGNPVFFILDGLDQIESADIELLKPLLFSLPWGTNNSYFFVSGNVEKLQKILPAHIFNKHKTFPAIRFTYPESLLMFDWPDSQTAKDVYEMWNGNPGNFAQIKRILGTGINVDDFLINDYTAKDDLLEKEWKLSKIEITNFENSITKFLCILVFDDNLRNLNKIKEIGAISDANFVEKVEKLTYIDLKGENAQFVSLPIKRYISKKLSKFERQTISILIQHYTKQQEDGYVSNLTNLYERSEDWNSIIGLLSPNRIESIVAYSQSFADVKKQLNFGYKASRNLSKSHENVFKFALYRSLINDLQRSDLAEYQLKALISLGRTNQAYELISKAFLMEDKLKMLIAYCKECNEFGEAIEPELITEIKELLNIVDGDFLKENIVDISIGLGHFMPDIAVKVLDKHFGGDSQESSLEILLNHINFVISNRDNRTHLAASRGFDNEKSASDFEARFTESIASGIVETPEKEIIEKIKSVENVMDKLYLLKSWLRRNAKSSQVIEVMEYGLGLVFESSTYIKPTTTNLLSIFHPIVFFQSKGNVEDWIKRMDQILLDIAHPINDRIKLQLWAVEALVPHDILLANERMVDLYETILSIGDVSVRTECFANCWLTIHNLELKKSVSLADFILQESEVKLNIEKSIEFFLTNSADHYDELRGSLTIIASIDLMYATSIAKRLNTYHRRSESLVKCIEVYCDKDFHQWNIPELLGVLESLKNGYLEEAIENIINSAFDHIDESSNKKESFVKLLNCIGLIKNGSLKAKLIVKSIRIILSDTKREYIRVPNYDNLVGRLIVLLRGFFDNVEDPIDRIILGYYISSSLAKVKPSLAEEYFDLTERLVDEFAINNESHYSVFSDSIRIMIRVYTKLMSMGRDLPYDKITRQIERIPSRLNKLRLWSELAVKIGLLGNRDILDEIVSQNILPAYESFRPKYSSPDFYEYLRASAAAVHMLQPETLKMYLKFIPEYQRESIVASVCYVLIKQVHESEPYSDVKGAQSFKYQQAIEVLNLLDNVRTDYLVHWIVRGMCAIARYYPSNFTIEQRSDITNRLKDVIGRKLPNVETGVGHDGFVIVTHACVLHFSNKTPYNRLPELDALVVKAQQIPNVTDRALVHILLAEECEIKSKREELLVKAVGFADQISSIKGKVGIYVDALDEMAEISRELFKNYVHKIQSDILKLDETERYNTYRNLIDVTFKHDKTLAKKLVSALDSDPGRKQFQFPVTDHYDYLNDEKLVSDDYSKITSVKSRRQISKMAVKMLGELNSKKRLAKSVDATAPLLYVSSKLPLSFSLPVFEFYIENITSRTPVSEAMLHSLYESADASTQLCFSFICHITNRTHNLLFNGISSTESVFVVKPGMRREGFNFIEKILKTHGSDELVISDPYFSEADLTSVRDFVYWSGASKVTILTSAEAKGDFTTFGYSNAWKKISAEEPPQLLVISAANQESKSPFHDRYIILPDKKVGVRLGTSINAIGISKISDLNAIGEDEVKLIMEEAIGPLIFERARSWQSQTVRYQTLEM